MIALAASLLLTLYLIVPSSIFRLFFGFHVPLRSFVRSRGEEILQGVLSILIPILLACALVWAIPFLNRHPFGFADTVQLRRADYKTVFAGVYSTESFDRSGEAFWKSLRRTARRQGRFIFWYYLLVAVEGWGVGKLSVSYPQLEKRSWYRWMAQNILLPNISAWHVLFTPFFFEDKENTIVWADILCSDGTLYRGVVHSHFLDKDGQLMGVILTGAKRFRRDDYLKDREKGPNDIDRANYWRPIPGTKFYIVGHKILNLNLTYEAPSPPPDKMGELISRRLRQPVTVTFQRKVR